MTTKQLNKILKHAVNVMTLADENSFKIKAFSNAIFTLEREPEDVSVLIKQKKLRKLKGIGASTHDAILNIFETGTFPHLDELKKLIPAEVIELLKINGLGAKKVRQLWLENGIDSIEKLADACNQNRLENIKGFGKKTQAKIQDALEFYLGNQGKFHLHKALNAANEIIELLEKNEIKALKVGELRRKCQEINVIELLLPNLTKKVFLDTFQSEIGLEVEDSGENLMIKTQDNIPVKLHFTDEKNATIQLFQLTGPDSFTENFQFEENFSLKDESELFSSKNLPFILPEARDIPNIQEKKRLLENKILDDSQLVGLFHSHSTYSDGANSIEQMAKATKKLGFSYLGLTDHSKTAFYANGLSESRIEVQHQEIDALNSKLKGFTILKGIESDILKDGELDYEMPILKSFDFIIASIHSQFDKTEKAATERLIKAIEHPETNILGHLTGRLLLVRKAYPINHKKIIDACVANQVAIEINSNPYRLDIDWRELEYAQSKNCMICISPDAHSKEGLEDYQFGVMMARKALYPSELVLNTKNLDELRTFFEK